MIILERDGSLVRDERTRSRMHAPDHDPNQQPRRAGDLIERASAAVGDRLRDALAGQRSGQAPGTSAGVTAAGSTPGWSM
jgi:phosphoglycolate phosphatase-like HAD superfamily hydrolase